MAEGLNISSGQWSDWTGHMFDVSELGSALIQFSINYQPWLCSLFASFLIGLSGILPLIIIPCDVGTTLKSGAKAKSLRLLLSFAVGGLLGDVFLHLLPEAWNHMAQIDGNPRYITTGLWVLTGVFTFIVVEMLFEKKIESENIIEEKIMLKCTPTNNNNNNNKQQFNSSAKNQKYLKSHLASYDEDHFQLSSQQNKKSKQLTNSKKKVSETREVTGYLNLLANGIDNFTHGLAVAGSFLVSFKVGMLTTFAILIHEIPHEIGDFAILLKSGFNRFEAAKAQMLTSLVGIVGAVAALSVGSSKAISDRTIWILPFTAGGFINIALVNVLPDILQEKDPKESIKQVACIVAGIGIMGIVTLFCE